MFQQTLRRLTALNSLVFLLVFVTFITTLYGYLSFRLFDKIDDAMRQQANAFQIANGRATLGRRSPFDPRIFLLLRSTDGRIISPSPFRTPEEISNMIDVAATVGSNVIETKEYENHVYRMLAVPYGHGEKQVASHDRFVIHEIIAVSIVDSEVDLLENLLWRMIVGLVIGTLGIVLAGHFLARRAMVPIQAAWEKQQRFVADASHELRTPIAGIYSNAELMLRHPEHTIEQESRRISTIMTESRRLSKLIASLLMLARSDANKEELQFSSVAVSEVVSVAASYFQSLTEVSQVTVTAHTMPDIYLRADRERLHQLLVILLDNAVKYTPPGGHVTVDCIADDKYVTIAVADTGEGIGAEHLPHVFDRFYRSDQARTGGTGTGLGLAIARWIAEKHGGTIRVASELGKGSTFTVVLPRNKAVRGKSLA